MRAATDGVRLLFGRRVCSADQALEGVLASFGRRAQSACAEQLAQSTCAEQLAQSTCAQQLAESNLRAAAWNNAACADRFREKSRGAVREESRMMRWSSHVTIHTEHRRAQTRSPQRCKKVSPRLDEHLWKNAFGPIVL